MQSSSNSFNLSGDVDDYQLLMADDSGEIESDLPPLDRGRPIGDLGFTVLALVAKERSANGEEKSTYRIVVWVNCTKYWAGICTEGTWARKMCWSRCTSRRHPTVGGAGRGGEVRRSRSICQTVANVLKGLKEHGNSLQFLHPTRS